MAAREKILQRLQDAAARRKPRNAEPDLETPLYIATDLAPVDWFQQNLEKVGGEVFRVGHLQQAISKLDQLAAQGKWTSVFCRDNLLCEAMRGSLEVKQDEASFPALQVSVTRCEFLVAHLGSALICSAEASGRRMAVYAENHVIIAHCNQLVNYLDEALVGLQDKYGINTMPSSITNITGPSRTADIEKTLIKGMHGPRRFIILLCDEPF